MLKFVIVRFLVHLALPSGSLDLCCGDINSVSAKFAKFSRDDEQDCLVAFRTSPSENAFVFTVTVVFHPSPGARYLRIRPQYFFALPTQEGENVVPQSAHSHQVMRLQHAHCDAEPTTERPRVESPEVKDRAVSNTRSDDCPGAGAGRRRDPTKLGQRKKRSS
jgi:hypothetical protein